MGFFAVPFAPRTDATPGPDLFELPLTSIR